MRMVHRVLPAVVLVAAACLPASRAAMAKNDRACSFDPAQVPRIPVKAGGVVVRSVPPERARVSTAWVERKTGIGISPDYADLPRVVVRIVDGKASSETLAAVVDGHVPRPGDHVELLSRYRDPRAPCSFIPWTVGATPTLS